MKVSLRLLFVLVLITNINLIPSKAFASSANLGSPWSQRTQTGNLIFSGYSTQGRNTLSTNCTPYTLNIRTVSGKSLISEIASTTSYSGLPGIIPYLRVYALNEFNTTIYLQENQNKSSFTHTFSICPDYRGFNVNRDGTKSFFAIFGGASQDWSNKQLIYNLPTQIIPAPQQSSIPAPQQSSIPAPQQSSIPAPQQTFEQGQSRTPNIGSNFVPGSVYTQDELHFIVIDEFKNFQLKADNLATQKNRKICIFESYTVGIFGNKSEPIEFCGINRKSIDVKYIEAMITGNQLGLSSIRDIPGSTTVNVYFKKKDSKKYKKILTTKIKLVNKVLNPGEYYLSECICESITLPPEVGVSGDLQGKVKVEFINKKIPGKVKKISKILN